MARLLRTHPALPRLGFLPDRTTPRPKSLLCHSIPSQNAKTDLTHTFVASDGTAEKPLQAPFVESLSFSTASDNLGLDAASSPVDGYKPKVNLPPRICTLRAFGKSGQGMITAEPEQTVSSFFRSLAANIEFSARIQDWEILSGRFAMMVFASAVLVEALTGSSVFEKLDPQRLIEICAAVVVSILGAAGFALAWQAKTRAAYTMSKGYENLINAFIDNVIDELLFDDEEP